MTSTITNRQTRRNSISAQAAMTHPTLESMGVLRVTPPQTAINADPPFQTERRMRRRSAHAAMTQHPTLESMGVLRVTPASNVAADPPFQTERRLRRLRPLRESRQSTLDEVGAIRTQPVDRVAPLQSISEHKRYHKANRRYCYTNPSGAINSYPAFVRRVLQDVWNRLEPQFQQGCKVKAWTFGLQKVRLRGTSPE